MTRTKALFFVSYTGHPFATTAVAFDSMERALEQAERSCSEAMRTDVLDCSTSPHGTLVASFNRSGRVV